MRAAAELPTPYGTFAIHVFESEGREHVALVRGEVWGKTEVPARVHSECFTGDVAGSLLCDCGEQLARALETIGASGCGVVLYLRQEGRGIGLVNKIRAYKLQQEQGLDTVDANVALGFADDERTYGVAVAMLRVLGVRSVNLMTNNPDKVRQLDVLGMPVAARVPHRGRVTKYNRRYLATKARRAGHLIDVKELELDE